MPKGILGLLVTSCFTGKSSHAVMVRTYLLFIKPAFMQEEMTAALMLKGLRGRVAPHMVRLRGA